MARRGPTLIQRSRRVSSAEKAAYHEVTGAGRRRTKRPFFGVNREDETAIFEQVARFVEQSIRRRGR